MQKVRSVTPADGGGVGGVLTDFLVTELVDIWSAWLQQIKARTIGNRFRVLTHQRQG